MDARFRGHDGKGGNEGSGGKDEVVQGKERNQREGRGLLMVTSSSALLGVCLSFGLVGIL